MNPDEPLTPREELEIRITALLMGQLPPEEAAELLRTIAADPELTALYSRMRHAVELLREARSQPEQAGQEIPLQLSEERRAALLAKFRGLKPMPPLKSVPTPRVLPSQQAVPAPKTILAPHQEEKRDWKWVMPVGIAASITILGGGFLLTEIKANRRSFAAAADRDRYVAVQIGVPIANDAVELAEEALPEPAPEAITASMQRFAHFGKTDTRELSSAAGASGKEALARGWAEQPGAVRTYDSTTDTKAYALYAGTTDGKKSADSPTPSRRASALYMPKAEPELGQASEDRFREKEAVSFFADNAPSAAGVTPQISDQPTGGAQALRITGGIGSEMTTAPSAVVALPDGAKSPSSGEATPPTSAPQRSTIEIIREYAPGSEAKLAAAPKPGEVDGTSAHWQFNQAPANRPTVPAEPVTNGAFAVTNSDFTTALPSIETKREKDAVKGLALSTREQVSVAKPTAAIKAKPAAVSGPAKPANALGLASAPPPPPMPAPVAATTPASAALPAGDDESRLALKWGTERLERQMSRGEAAKSEKMHDFAARGLAESGLEDSAVKLAEVKQANLDEKNFTDLGRYNLADKEAQKILNLDKYNKAAEHRRQSVTEAKTEFGEVAYNSARSQAIWEVKPQQKDDAVALHKELKERDFDSDALALGGMVVTGTATAQIENPKAAPRGGVVANAAGAVIAGVETAVVDPQSASAKTADGSFWAEGEKRAKDSQQWFGRTSGGDGGVSTRSLFTSGGTRGTAPQADSADYSFQADGVVAVDKFVDVNGGTALGNGFAGGLPGSMRGRVGAVNGKDSGGVDGERTDDFGTVTDEKGRKLAETSGKVTGNAALNFSGVANRSFAEGQAVAPAANAVTDAYSVDLDLAPQVVDFEGFINYGSPIQTTSIDKDGKEVRHVITSSFIAEKGEVPAKTDALLNNIQDKIAQLGDVAFSLPAPGDPTAANDEGKPADSPAATRFSRYIRLDGLSDDLAAIKLPALDKVESKLEQKVPEQVVEAKPEPELQKNQMAKAEPPAPPQKIEPPVPQPEVLAKDNAFSTFSLNVSDVSFKLAQGSLEKSAMPDVASVRVEEFINALDYRDPEPLPGAPLAFASERARYPFAHNRDLLRLSVKTAAEGRQAGRPLNLVLLLDNSGSMERADRVRILQEALTVLAKQLQPQDKLSIITFSRTPRLWADGVSGDKAGEFTGRVAEIRPEGGTDLGAAMDLGYATALKHYQVGSVNRVVLLTDGAANLGNVDAASLKGKVEKHRKQGVAFDCFGVGWEGYNDDLLEQLSRNGDGRYGFINTPEAAATEFAGALAGALRVAASDVKVQVEFNPKRVTSYRQLGYAKHQLKKEQFRDNTVDAAEIGAAEAGNALYTLELDPRGQGDIATVRVRFKVPGTTDYKEHEWTVPFTAPAPAMEQSSSSLRLAATAGAFGEFLAQSPFAAEVNTDKLLGMVNGIPAIYGADPRPGKLEWMIRQAKSISGR